MRKVILALTATLAATGGDWRRGDAPGVQENLRKALELQPGFSSDDSAENYGVAGP